MWDAIKPDAKKLSEDALNVKLIRRMSSSIMVDNVPR